MNSQYLMPNYKRLPVTFVEGKDEWLVDEKGREYLDFLSGLGVVALGHSNQTIAKTVYKQMQTLVHTSNLYYTQPQAELAEKLSKLSLGGKVFFANSGAEANEAAIKLARKYGKEKLGGAFEIISALNSFHGRTMGALTATGQPDKQEDFKPLPEGFKYVEFNGLDDIKHAISDKTCAVMLEVIQGEGGVVIGDPEYLKSIEALCKNKQILLIIDEVQTGLCRTGKFFGYQNFGIKPDLITVAKALANGLPIGALAVSPELSDILTPGSHASTFGGGPVICQAAIKVLEMMEKQNVAEKVKSTGAYFIERLNELKAKTNRIKEIRGMGLMIALQFSSNIAEKVMNSCLEMGLLVNNVKPDTIRFLPPLIIDRKTVDICIGFLTEIIMDGLTNED